MTQHRGAGETQQESSNIPSSAPILEDYNPQSEERKSSSSGLPAMTFWV